jgi:hypothetical protein
MGLGSGLPESASTLSRGSFITGTAGIGGGSISVMEYFRLLKKEDVFFCNVWVVDWCEDGGGVDDLGCVGKAATWGDEVVLDTADLDDPPNILLKKPGFSFGWGVTFSDGTDTGADPDTGGTPSFVFS